MYSLRLDDVFARMTTFANVFKSTMPYMAEVTACMAALADVFSESTTPTDVLACMVVVGRHLK